MQILFSVKSMKMFYGSVPSVFIFQLASVNAIIGKEQEKTDDLRKLSAQNMICFL